MIGERVFVYRTSVSLANSHLADELQPEVGLVIGDAPDSKVDVAGWAHDGTTFVLFDVPVQTNYDSANVEDFVTESPVPTKARLAAGEALKAQAVKAADAKAAAEAKAKADAQKSVDDQAQAAVTALANARALVAAADKAQAASPAASA